MRPERKRTGEAIPYSYKKQILSSYENTSYTTKNDWRRAGKQHHLQ
jgi:hypothetical protein